MLEILASVNMHVIPSPEMPELDWECCFVAETNEKMIGMSGYKILSTEEAKTTLMVVLPEFRGCEVGKALQTKRMEALLEKNIRYLTTNADRPKTIKWYKKHFGYKEIGFLPKVHEFGHPEIDQWTTLRTDLIDWSKTNKT